MQSVGLKEAFSALDASLSHGYPVQARQILLQLDLPTRLISSCLRTYARTGSAMLERWGSTEWLVPKDAKLSLEEYKLIIEPSYMAVLSYLADMPVFSRSEAITYTENNHASTAVKSGKTVFLKLREMSLVELSHKTDDGDELYFISATGRRVLAAYKDYRPPIFSDKNLSRDLSKFHNVIDI